MLALTFRQVNLFGADRCRGESIARCLNALAGAHPSFRSSREPALRCWARSNSSPVLLVGGPCRRPGATIIRSPPEPRFLTWLTRKSKTVRSCLSLLYLACGVIDDADLKL